ncbi:zinc finger protein 235 [Patella vulgata]|uniref:zinc finger protein 235 n=1 Tax=Patella vulgata TaxID=6465 RepID=UPI00217F9EAC|nr:zinc finger protein 235 [Patella vulgata]
METNNPEVQTLHQCVVCDEMFQQYSDLEDHNKIHVKDEKTDATDLDEYGHIPVQFDGEKTVNDNKTLHHCKLCDETFKLYSDLEIHCENHAIEEESISSESISNKTQQSQPLDENQLENNSKINVHIKEEKTEDIKTYHCKLCNDRFEFYADLEKHCKIHIKDEDNGDPIASTSSQCKVSNESLDQEIPPIANSNDSNNKSSRPTRSRGTAKIKSVPTCELCGRTFTQQSSLKTHMSIHTGEKPFQCGVCGKSFNQNKRLEGHMRTHTGEKPYKCEVCGNTFALNSSLRHHKRTHTGEKPFRCDVCSRPFSRNCLLKQHMRIHTGEKPYNCLICGKWFRHSHYLQTHIKLHSKQKSPRGRAAKKAEETKAKEESSSSSYAIQNWSYI